MENAISYCGLICETCPIYLATRKENKSKKAKMIYDIIDMCKTYYGVEYNYEDIVDCDGCKSNRGRLFTNCKVCDIRKCAIERGIDNCGYCNDYACEKLLEVFNTDSAAKERLDKIRKGNCC